MRNILIVVDMQNDFIDGALGTAEAQAMVERTATHIRARREAGWTVVATMDTHGENYMDTQEGRKLPVPHCIKGTDGWQFPDIIRDALGVDCIIVEKPTFGSARLPEVVRELCGDETPVTLEFVGLCTDICVVSNALLLKAFYPEIEMRVVADCCAGVTPEKHRAALETMASCQITVL